MIAPVLGILVACFGLALLTVLAKGRFSSALSWLSTTILGFFSLFLMNFMAQPPAAPSTLSLLADPLSGLSLSFYIDGLSLTFLLLISAVGTLILIYGQGYFASKGQDWLRCLGFLQLFIAGMIGLVTAGNLLLLFIFWELTSLSSYFLIGFDFENKKARSAALKALLLTGFGGLALLAGIILIGIVGGSLELSGLFASTEAFHQSPLTPYIIVLVLTGCFAKSAQFPFHVWLPSAMAAPTPVSAYLHSATMVKAGVFLAARLTPLFSGFVLWSSLLLFVGALTAVWSILLALRSQDLKEILAYTTVSALGLLMALLGMGSETAVKAALVFLIVHALYKAGLFMLAGSLDKMTGSRDIDQLAGVLRTRPVLASSTLLLCLSMAGFPLFLGFIAKELIYEASFHLSPESLALGLVAILAVLLTVSVAYSFFVTLFSGRSGQDLPVKPISALMIAPPAVLALISLGLGLFPQPLADYILEPGLLSVQGLHADIELKLWHGFNWILLASLTTLLVGALIGARRRLAASLLKSFDRLSIFSPQQLLSELVLLFQKSSNWLTDWLFGGGYGRGIQLLLVSLCITLIYALSNLIGTSIGTWAGAGSPVDALGLIAAFLIIVPALLVLYFRSRISAVLIAGVSGLGIALLFAALGAPDLAITQMLVETFVLILFVFVVRRLPRVQRQLPGTKNIKALGLSFVASAGLSAMVYWSLQHQSPRPLARFFIENSKALAYGQNVVNVILVDFRAFDTLGEITVLTLATLGIVSLRKLARRSKDGISDT